MTSIYQRLLGVDFDTLSPVLKTMHGPAAEVNASGSIEVKHGKGMLAKLIAKVAGFPPQGQNVPIRLCVSRTQDHEVWMRWFADQPFRTDQYLRKGKLVEKSGSTALVFDLSVKEGNLIFNQTSTSMFGIPLPGFLGVKTSATTSAEATGWKIDVQVVAPLAGLVLQYSGSLTPLP